MASSRHASPYITSQHNRSYVLDLLRNFDNENYLAILLQPSKSVARCHAALRAFNVELAQIRSNVSNEDLGRIRIQYFRDSLTTILEDPHSTPSSPVLQCLAEAISAFPDTNFCPLHILLDARDADLAFPNYATIDQLEQFAARTQGVLINLHTSISMQSTSPAAEAAALAAAKGVGLAIVLRGVPVHAASRLSYMPRDAAKRLNISNSELLSGSGESHALFKEVAIRAEDLLHEARCARMEPPLWPVDMAALYLSRLRRAGYNPFDEKLQTGLRATYPLALQWRLLGRRLRAVRLFSEMPGH